MFRRAAIAAIFLRAFLRAAPQTPEAAQQPITLKSAAHAVQLDVIVEDSSGRAVHGLRKEDFVLTDNGHPRAIRIFAGEIESKPDVYSNRLGPRDSRPPRT